MNPNSHGTKVFAVFLIVGGAFSCYTGACHYWRVDVDNCAPLDGYLWVSIFPILVASAFIFRKIHSLAGGASEHLNQRTWSLLIVMGLLWISAWFVMPYSIGAIDRGRQKRTMDDMRELANALHQYRHAHGAYPITQDPDEMRSLVLEFSRIPKRDAWGSPWVVHVSNSSYTLVSLGKCGKPEFPSPAHYNHGITAGFYADIIFSDGEFVRWPEGNKVDR